MSEFEDMLARVIDPAAALRSIERWVFGDSDRPRAIEAAALVHLDCGHVRPMNMWFDPGDELACHLCGPARVVSLELIEPTEFPACDALRDLPEAS